MKKSNFSVSTSLFLALFMIIQLVFVALFLGSCELSNGDTEASVQSQDPTETVYGVEKWFDYYGRYTEMREELSQDVSFTLPELELNITYNNRVFFADGKEILNIDTGDSFYNAMPASVYFADITGDGIRDMCITLDKTVHSLGFMNIGFMNIYTVQVVDLTTNNVYYFADYDNYFVQEIIPNTAFKEHDGTLYMIDVTTGNDLIYTLSTIGNALNKTLIESDNLLPNAIVAFPASVKDCIYFYNSLNTVESYYHLSEDELATLKSLVEAAETERADKLLLPEEREGYISINDVHIYFGNDEVYVGTITCVVAPEEMYDFLMSLKDKSASYRPQ